MASMSPCHRYVSCTRACARAFSLSRILYPSLSPPPPRWLGGLRALPLLHTLSLSFYLSLSHTHSLSLALSCSLLLSLALSLRTHTHPLSPKWLDGCRTLSLTHTLVLSYCLDELRVSMMRRLLQNIGLFCRI